MANDKMPTRELSGLRLFDIEISIRRKVLAESLEDAYFKASIWAIDEKAHSFGASEIA